MKNTINTAREAFEFWYSDEGKTPRAVAKSGGHYELMGAQLSWAAWLAAWCYRLPKWAPIKSAPRDGTAILGFWPGVNISGSSFAVTEVRDGEWRPAGEDRDDDWCAPLYWMPLPPSPVDLCRAGDDKTEFLP